MESIKQLLRNSSSIVTSLLPPKELLTKWSIDIDNNKGTLLQCNAILETEENIKQILMDVKLQKWFKSIFESKDDSPSNIKQDANNFMTYLNNMGFTLYCKEAQEQYKLTYKLRLELVKHVDSKSMTQLEAIEAYFSSDRCKDQIKELLYKDNSKVWYGSGMNEFMNNITKLNDIAKLSGDKTLCLPKELIFCRNHYDHEHLPIYNYKSLLEYIIEKDDIEKITKDGVDFDKSKSDITNIINTIKKSNKPDESSTINTLEITIGELTVENIVKGLRTIICKIKKQLNISDKPKTEPTKDREDYEKIKAEDGNQCDVKDKQTSLKQTPKHDGSDHDNSNGGPNGGPGSH